MDLARRPCYGDALMLMNSPKVPEVITCANLACGRKLDSQSNQGYPDSTVPLGYIHKHYDLSLPSISVACSKCGHYTIRYPTNPPI